MSIRQLIVFAFALAFLVSAFACARPGVNELEDPPRAKVSGKSVSLGVQKQPDPAFYVTAWVPQFRARGEVFRIGSDGGVRVKCRLLGKRRTPGMPFSGPEYTRASEPPRQDHGGRHGGLR